MEHSVSTLLLKVAERFEKCPTLKYAANNARILAEPEKYSPAEIQSCPEPVLSDSNKTTNIVRHEMGENDRRYTTIRRRTR